MALGHGAVGERSGILLHLPLPLVGVSIGTERGCQQNGSLADGYVLGTLRCSTIGIA